MAIVDGFFDDLEGGRERERERVEFPSLRLWYTKDVCVAEAMLVRRTNNVTQPGVDREQHTNFTKTKQLLTENEGRSRQQTGFDRTWRSKIGDVDEC